MPELPDLEVFSHNLDQQLSGRMLKEISVKNVKKLNVPAQELHQKLEKQKLVKVYRLGKELYFEFENKTILGLHLMLNGELHLLKNKKELPKYTIVDLLFKDGTSLTLTDFRGLAKATLDPPVDEAPDALAKEVDQQFFKKVLSGKKAAVKNVLMDQHVIRGIGNAYADEILWEAGISPFSASDKIPDTKIKDLSKAVHHVLENAIRQIRKSNPDIISGEVRDFLKIHSPKKTNSPAGVPIQMKKTGARKTYYTDEQELF